MSMDSSIRRVSAHRRVPIAGILLFCVVACATKDVAPLNPGSKVVVAESASGGSTIPSPSALVPVAAPGLRNLVSYHADVISGSAPLGTEGFDTLASFGVRTVVSVDGATPDVEAARARGMRYIHLPVGYDGFDEERRLHLTRAVLDGLDSGPVYIHCHHGLHRSAGAAAAVAVGAGWSTPEEAIGRMRVSGTSPRYRGLYLCAAESTPIDPSRIESVDPDFPEVHRPDDFVQMMVEMDLALEHLESIAEAGWRTPEAHPDLVPAAEAGRLADLLRLASEGTRASRESDADFSGWLARQSGQVAGIEARLLVADVDVLALDRSLAAIRGSCIGCHAVHRD
ncbi:MAG: hypothetical protein CMJ51_07290 [Planctomycetaceae bacterium]|nr:hypothetical protein [Planctomycetaceae bacterium]